MSTQDTLDMLVLGAGPAGAAAAAFAAKENMRVVLLDQNQPQPTTPQIEWLSPNADRLLEKLEMKRDEFVIGSINAVRFIDIKNCRTAKATLKPAVDLVLTQSLLEQLKLKAKELGAVLNDDAQIVAINPHEETIRLVSADDQELAGKFLVAADGSESWAAKKLGIYPQTLSSRQSLGCQWTSLRTGSPNSRKSPPSVELSVLFTSENLADFNYICRIGDAIAVGFVANADADAGVSRFEQTLDWGKTDGILPADLKIDSNEQVYRKIPRGLALDMETHGAKRSLVVGDAGGFVATLSHEGLYPAIWSADLAVETCANAMKSSHPQDTLADFDNRWRQEMVEYLRLPNVDLRFLMPLMFSNEQMAQKLARAFLYGENL